MPSVAADNLPVPSIEDADADQGTLVNDPASAADDKENLPEGWGPLVWSFAASGAMTVSTIQSSSWAHVDRKRIQLLAYFFPALFSIPVFGQYLAREWLWTFTPSLSYIGQGVNFRQLEIIP